MSATFIQEQISVIEAAIVSAQDAEAAILAGGIQSYSIDTGQTKTVVTKLNITELRKYIDAKYNQLVTLEARLTGSGVVFAGPRF